MERIVKRHNAHTKQMYARTHTGIQRAKPWQYFSSLFEVVSHGRLWDCGSFHPLKHTLARREREIADAKMETEETVGGVLLLKHSAAHLIPIFALLPLPVQT